MRLRYKPLVFATSAIVVYFMVQTIFLMTTLDGWTTRFPYWDSASHILDSIHFAKAFRELSVTGFLEQLRNSAMWPPVIPLIEAPFLMLFGENFLVARHWTLWSSIPAILAVFIVGLYTHQRLGLFVAAIAASLLAVSPYFLEFCMQDMMEVPGTVFCMMTLFFYLRYLHDGKIKFWRYTCLAGIVLFFCKFNYAVLFMLPIVVCELCRKPQFRSMLANALRSFARDVNWKGPFTIFVLLYVLFLIYVQKVGIRFDLFGHHVTIERALGNLSYLLIALVLIRNAIVNRDNLKRYVRSIWQAPEPVHSLLRFDIVPALIWLSYPDFFTTFFIFMFSEKTRHTSFWSMETLTYYPGALVYSYAPHPWIGFAVLAMPFVLLVFWRRLSIIPRFFVALSLFNFALTITHPNYQQRYLLTTVPLLFIVCGLGVLFFFEWIMKNQDEKWDKAMAIIACLVAGLVVWRFQPVKARLQASFERSNQDPKVREAMREICKEVVKVERNTLVGFSNAMSPAGIALQCYEDFPESRRSQMATTMIRIGFHGETSGQRIVASHKIENFFVMDYSQLGGDVGRLQEAFLLEDVKKALETDTGYERRELINQGQNGYRVTLFKLKMH